MNKFSCEANRLARVVQKQKNTPSWILTKQFEIFEFFFFNIVLGMTPDKFFQANLPVKTTVQQ